MSVADSNSSDDDIPIVMTVLWLDYQVLNGAPGLEVETKDDTSGIAHCTRATCAH